MSKTFDGIPSDWAHHLKPYGKRMFWRKVRNKGKALSKEIQKHGEVESKRGT